MKTLRVIYRYLQDDPNCSSDCEGFQLIVDGKQIKYGDEPWARGPMWETRYPTGPLRAFICGVQAADPGVQIIEEEKADLPC